MKLKAKVYRVLIKYRYFLNEYNNSIENINKFKTKHSKNSELLQLLEKIIQSPCFNDLDKNTLEINTKNIFRNKPINFFDFYSKKIFNFLKYNSTIDFFSEKNLLLSEASILLISLSEFSKLTRDNIEKEDILIILSNLDETAVEEKIEKDEFLDTI